MGSAGPFLYILGKLTHNLMDVYDQTTRTNNTFRYLSQKRIYMNRERIKTHLNRSIHEFPDIQIIPPGSLTSGETASAMISLLQSVYVNHGIANNREAVKKDLESGSLRTWLAKSDGEFVATASLVKQTNGDVELGRAVSRKKGAGKILMASAAISHIESDRPKPIVAEVRVADEFWGVPNSFATQHLCFELFDLIPHAIAPFFSHGSPLRNESFVLARSDRTDRRTVSELAREPLNNRNMNGSPIGLTIIQTKPFKIVVPKENGRSLDPLSLEEDFMWKEGFTLFPIETTDRNLPLIGSLLSNPRMVLCGIDHFLGKNDKPIVFIGTIGADTKMANTKITEAISQPMRRDLQTIADKFVSLGNQKK